MTSAGTQSGYMNHLPNEQSPFLCFLSIARKLQILELKAKKRKWKYQEWGTKCTLNLFIRNYCLCLQSIVFLIPLELTQSLIYFFKEGRLVCHHFGMCSEKSPGTLHLSWRRQWRHLTAAFFSLFYYFLNQPQLLPLQTLTLVNGSKVVMFLFCRIFCFFLLLLFSCKTFIRKGGKKVSSNILCLLIVFFNSTFLFNTTFWIVK